MSRQINFCSDRKKSFHTKLDAMIQILNLKTHISEYLSCDIVLRIVNSTQYILQLTYFT